MRHALQDLKSSHILLSKAGVAKINHIGFANIDTKTSISVRPSEFTLAWTAPEVNPSLSFFECHCSVIVNAQS